MVTLSDLELLGYKKQLTGRRVEIKKKDMGIRTQEFHTGETRRE